jgi:hypothetical protein
MGQHLTPSCDVCGTEKQFRRGIGSYCPNVNCGGTETPETIAADSPPTDGKFVMLSAESVGVVLEERLRKEPMLDKVKVTDLFAALSDGSERRLTGLKVQVRYPKPNRTPGPKRTAFSKKHPDGVTLRLASRDGVAL